MQNIYSSVSAHVRNSPYSRNTMTLHKKRKIKEMSSKLEADPEDFLKDESISFKSDLLYFYKLHYYFEYKCYL